MADSTTDTNKYFKAFDPVNPTADNFNYEAFLGDIKNTADQTRQVTQVELPKIEPAVAGDSRVQAAVNQFEASKQTTQKQAENAARAIEMKGANVANQMKNISALETGVTANKDTATNLYNKAAASADEYVANVKQRATDSLKKLEEINTQIGQDRDFSKAHAMQAGVQATVGAMNDEGRVIAEKYGADSKEYQQWQDRKQTSLGAMYSNLTTTFQQFKETQDLSYLSAVNETMYRADQYASFADQTKTETLLNIANQSNQYNLQASTLQISLEQMKGTSLDGIATWISESPVFTMDVQPLISLVSDIMAEQEANRRARESEMLTENQFRETQKQNHIANLARIGALWHPAQI
jgi:hypothetical protein